MPLPGRIDVDDGFFADDEDDEDDEDADFFGPDPDDTPAPRPYPLRWVKRKGANDRR